MADIETMEDLNAKTIQEHPERVLLAGVDCGNDVQSTKKEAEVRTAVGGVSRLYQCREIYYFKQDA